MPAEAPPPHPQHPTIVPGVPIRRPSGPPGTVVPLRNGTVSLREGTRERLVGLLSSTVNGCLQELGYAPAMLAQLKFYESQNVDLARKVDEYVEENAKLFADNTKLIQVNRKVKGENAILREELKKFKEFEGKDRAELILQYAALQLQYSQALEEFKRGPRPVMVTSAGPAPLPPGVSPQSSGSGPSNYHASGPIPGPSLQAQAQVHRQSPTQGQFQHPHAPTTVSPQSSGSGSAHPSNYHASGPIPGPSLQAQARQSPTQGQFQHPHAPTTVSPQSSGSGSAHPSNYHASGPIPGPSLQAQARQSPTQGQFQHPHAPTTVSPSQLELRPQQQPPQASHGPSLSQQHRRPAPVSRAPPIGQAPWQEPVRRLSSGGRGPTFAPLPPQHQQSMMVQGIPPPPPRMNSQPLPGQPSLGWQPPALVPVQRSGSGGSGQRQGGYMQQIPPHLQQHSHPQQNYPPPSYQQQPHHQPGPSHSASQSQQPQAFSLTDARENHAPAMQPYAQQQLIRRYSDGQMVQQPYEYQQQQPQQYLHYQQPPPPPPLHRPSQASHSPTTHAQSPLSLFPPVLSTDTPPTTGTSPSQPLSLGMSYSRSPTQQQPMPIQVPMNPTHIRVQIPPTHPQQHHLPTPPDSGSPLPRPQVQAQAQAPIQTRTQSSIASALGPVPPNQPPLQMSELALNITNFPPWQQSGSGPGSPAVHGGQSLALPERQSQSQLVQVPVRDGDADGGASTSPIVIADETGPSSSRVEPVVSVKTEQQPNVDVAQAEASSSRSQSARAEVEAVRPDVLETDGDVPMLDAADDDDTPSPAQDADTPSEGHEAITPPQSLKRMSADREDASDGDADPRKRPRIGIAEERGGSGHELETVAEEVEVKKELLAEAEAEADSLVVKMELMDDVERARIMAEAEEANEDEFVEVDDEGKRTKDDCVKAMFHQDWICKFCKRRAEVVGEPLPPSFVAASLEERAQHCESEHPIAWNHLRNSVNDDESDHDDNDDEDED